MMLSSQQSKQLLIATQALDIYPIDVLVVGATGSGKTTTLEALMPKGKRKRFIRQHVSPDTQTMTHYRIHPHLRLWDSMGLGDSPQNDALHQSQIKTLLQQSYPYQHKHYAFIDMVLLIIDGTSRDIGTATHLINHVLLPNIPIERIVIAINQADRAMKGLHWDSLNHAPFPPLRHYLEHQSHSIGQRLSLSCHQTITTPTYYSARYQYHVSELLSSLLLPLPNKKRERVPSQHHNVIIGAT
jgi:uncharacterized protein